ncbi:MarR family transcriptional regulator, partial [Streptomyces seoulensis]
MEPESPQGEDAYADDLADALVGVQRMIRRRLRAGLTVARLRGAEVELLRLIE